MNVKSFLQHLEIKELVAKGDLETVYEKCNQAYVNRNNLTQYLLDLGVNPLDYFKESIPADTFFQCKNLTHVVIPDGVTTIGEYAFYGCDNLTSVIIPDSVTRIGWNAFRNCKSLTDVTIGTGMTIIGEHAFRYCTSLTAINYTGTREQWKKVRRNKGWRVGTPITVIHCIDGDIKIKQ